MPAFSALVDAGHFAIGNIHTIEVLLQGALGIGCNDHGLALGIKSQQVGHHPITTGELTQFIAIDIKQIQVIITVFLTPHDELLLVPGQESDGVLRLHIFVIVLTVKC